MLTKGDKYLILSIIIISVLSLVYVKNLAVNHGKKYISVQVNGEEVKEFLMIK